MAKKKEKIVEQVVTNNLDIDFERLSVLIKDQFSLMCKNKRLFIASVNGDKLWDLYINSFAPEDNYVFRDPSSTVNTCRNDKNFITRYGNVVSLDKDNNIVTMFDINVEGSIYEASITNMRNALKEATITSTFFISYDDLVKMSVEKLPRKYSDLKQTVLQLGHKVTHKKYTKEEVNKFGKVNSDEIYVFHHFWAEIPKHFVLDKSIGSIYADINTTHQLFVKGLTIPLETLKVIRELMVQGSLLRAELYQYKVDEFINIKQEYEAVTSNKNNWTWNRFQDIKFARFAGELIGETCIDLAQGKDINEVCKSFNVYVDAANYMKAKAPITESQKNQSIERITELGYEPSFDRRFATIHDIDINEILHSNAPSSTVKQAGIFSKVKATANVGMSRHKKAEFKEVQEVSIETFMKDILPNSTALYVLLENNFESNFVSLTTANDKTAKNPFKWDNPPNLMSWTYNGNIAAKSNLTQQVVAKGGRVDGVFRFTHSWNEIEPNNSLMDLHVFLPTHRGQEHKGTCHDTYGNSNRVGWNHRNDPKTKGSQDVDYVDVAPPGYIPVENITFPNLALLPEGEYKCKIHNWSFRNKGGKGRAEIACGGNLYQYIYPATKNKEWVDIATATLKDGSWSIEHHIPPIDEGQKTVWGINTEEFHKVNLMCLSPNYWGDNAVGVKHYFFMLDKCNSDVALRSFHIENLNAELQQDKRLLEVFGTTTLLEPTNNQLAGLGFTDDSKETIVVKVEGSFKRIIRIRF